MKYFYLAFILFMFSNTIGATFKLAKAIDIRAAQITEQLAER